MDDRRLGLVRQTAEAWRRDVAERADLEQRGPAAGPGELYVLPPAGGNDEGIEWLVVQGEPSDGAEHFFVVAADVVPLAGSADVAVTGSFGPLTVRCGVGAWVDARQFDPVRRTGLVDAVVLSSAREKCRRIAAGKLRGTAVEREVDRDPEYREWCETLAAARAGLARGTTPSPRPRSRSDHRRTRHRALALAASVAAAVTALLLIGPDGPAPERAADALINLPIVGLSNQPSRGQATPITLPAGAPGLFLVLAVPDGEPDGARYRMEIRLAENGETVAGRDSLRAVGVGEITLVLHRGELPAGDYELLLYRDGDPGELLAGRFRMRLVVEADGP